MAGAEHEASLGELEKNVTPFQAQDSIPVSSHAESYLPELGHNMSSEKSYHGVSHPGDAVSCLSTHSVSTPKALPGIDSLAGHIASGHRSDDGEQLSMDLEDHPLVKPLSSSVGGDASGLVAPDTLMGSNPLLSPKNSKSIICPICNKELAYSSSLSTHMRVHTGRKNPSNVASARSLLPKEAT
ncbi:hypothetical protein DPMN_182952 [Dreissena polymorpha]|uniref:C2H2-type domain-containing protein n=1 Tax=Dreissena polymorpha TaxID=45954 RepID=A0A9D4DGC9_DREPO|nr:hypothetical protein DPMN_182952 [Dreissena polymorpha]